MAFGRGRKDYYSTLGVPRDAKPDTIRKTYRHLARKLHPDVNPGDSAAEDRFKEVQEAYGVLNDNKKREFYDRHGFYSDQAYTSGGPTGPGTGDGFGFDGFDFNDFAGQGAPDLGSLFESVLGGHRRKAPSTDKRPGEDLEYTLEVGFEDAIRGTEVRLNIQRYRPCGPCSASGSSAAAPPHQCQQCSGSGKSNVAMGNMRFSVPCPACQGEGLIRTPCPSCGGDGRVRETSAVETRIPAGTGENSRLRIPGKGNAGVRGGPAGDLYVVARVGKHPFFERKGYDIYIQVPVTPAEAVLGAKIEVPTIDGKAFLRVPPATNSGKTFRVRGRGVTDPRSGERGDQFVRITIVVPEIPDEATKDLMREYSERNPENPRRALMDAA